MLEALASEQENQEPAKRYALIIKNNEFTDPMLSQLVKPDSNVNELAELLDNPTVGAFDQVVVLQNEPAHTIRRAVSQFFANKKPEDMLLVYFSGHAAVGSRSRLYLAANNTEHTLLRGTAIPAGFIADEMDNSQSKHQILILDCHFSSAVETELPSLVGQTVNSGAMFARNGHDRVVITATDSTQYNWTRNNLRGKATPLQFTRHLIYGLRTGAADINQDGNITIDELFAYIYDCMSRNSVDEQIQVPRKWTPFSANDGDGLVIGYANQYRPNDTAVTNLYPAIPQAKPVSAITTRFGKLPKSYVRWAAAIILLMTIGLLFLTSGNRNSFTSNDQTVAAANATVSPAVEEPTTESSDIVPVEPTATVENEMVGGEETAVYTPTAIPTNIPTLAPTETMTATPEPTLTDDESITTVALLSSTIFTSPDADSQEVAFVGVGAEVEILGRSRFGEWLYVRTDDNEVGYVYGPRFDFEGDYESLPVASTTSTATSTPNVAACAGDCPTLKIDLYDLPSPRCTADNKYRTIFILGHGGDESYTYYWDGEYLAGPTSEGFGFDVLSLDGSAVIGRGRIVSGDGQVIEKELFVSNFSCNN